MKEFLKNKERIIILILTLWAIFITIAFISNKINTTQNLDTIIYNAKKEAENTLASTGRMIYAEDVENLVGAGLASARNENLPENTTETPQGTVVLPKENWNIETVTAVSVGNGETVPVPKGFYYVGGDLNTGVIISDDQADEYDGETDKTTYEYTTNLKGNQFVWIPCTEDEYKKCEVWNGIIQNSGTLANCDWDKTTYTSELPQIRKYGGFYVARYEAGLANTITEFTSTQIDTRPNQVYNKEGIPQSRAGQVPWNFIDWNHAQSNAKNMYNTESVSSGLITGTQWDSMLKQMVVRTDLTETDVTNAEKWGNFLDNSIEYTGRKSEIYLISRMWYQSAFGGIEINKTVKQNSVYLTTGASRQTEVYHIFDVAGNIWEWTEEVSGQSSNILYRIMRGGCSGSFSNADSTCYRNSFLEVNSNCAGIGFRVVLYVK